MSSNLIVNNIEVGAGATIYTAASNTLTFGTNGSEKVRITSAGLVGIGTNNPNEDLHIASNSPYIKLQDYDNNRSWRIKGTAWFAIEDITAGTDRLRISSTGNVSIGDNVTPDTLLHIQGDQPKLRIESTNALSASAGTEEIARIEFEATKGSNLNVAASMRVRQDGTWSTVDDWFSPTAIEFYTQDQSGSEITTPRLTIASDGDVIIGGTDAGYPNFADNLTIHDTQHSGITIRSGIASQGAVYFSDATGSGAGTYVGNIIYDHSDNHMRFATSGNERLRIKSDGNIVATGNIKSNNLPGRNLLINGAMRVNQKGNLTHNSDGYQVADMWWWGKYSTDQLVTTQANVTNDHPDEFDHSYKLSVATAETTLDNNEYGILRTRIEGQNLQHLKTGTASAKELTLSFWAKTASANSGDTYSVCIVMGDISGNDRIQYRTFAPTSTWQRFTMSFVGQTNNQIRNDHDYGITIHYVLAAGSSKVTSANTTWSLNTSIKGVTGQSNFFDNTSNEFYVTGVQLEVGSIATEYEHKSYDEELARCQRYCVVYGDNDEVHLGIGVAYNSTNINLSVSTPVTMRQQPGISKVTSGGNWLQSYMGATGHNSNASVEVGEKVNNNIRVYCQTTGHSSLSVGQGLWCQVLPNAKLIFTAEL